MISAAPGDVFGIQVWIQALCWMELRSNLTNLGIPLLNQPQIGFEPELDRFRRLGYLPDGYVEYRSRRRGPW